MELVRCSSCLVGECSNSKGSRLATRRGGYRGPGIADIFVRVPKAWASKASEATRPVKSRLINWEQKNEGTLFQLLYHTRTGPHCYNNMVALSGVIHQVAILDHLDAVHHLGAVQHLASPSNEPSTSSFGLSSQRGLLVLLLLSLRHL